MADCPAENTFHEAEAGGVSVLALLSNSEPTADAHFEAAGARRSAHAAKVLLHLKPICGSAVISERRREFCLTVISAAKSRRA